MQVHQKFEELSRQIWSDIDNAHQLGIFRGEETITDTILLDLARQQYPNIRIVQTTKPKESSQGTDWEWYVGSNHFGWVRFAIQAKKAHATKYAYHNLNHEVKLPSGSVYQPDLLRKFATVNGAVPLYCFYNYCPTASTSHWHCVQNYEQELLGWTFTPLRNVESVINRRIPRNFNHLHRFKDTLPIRCLFRCPHFTEIYQMKIGEERFLGESFRRIDRLPQQFITAQDIGTLDNFPGELYNSNIQIYPKRIAIIELDY